MRTSTVRLSCGHSRDLGGTATAETARRNGSLFCTECQAVKDVVRTPQLEALASAGHYPEEVSDELYAAALDAWRHGTEYTVTLKGEPVARLVPLEKS